MRAATGAPATRSSRLRARLTLQDRLLRTASPLLMTTGLNGLLGVGYWVIAARHYDQVAVAQGLALVSAMTTLSGVSQLNLGPGLSVLVPAAGARARRVVAQAYAAATVFSVPVLLVFLVLVLPHLTVLSQVLTSTPMVVLFVAAVVAFNLFTLQDAALVSLRWGRWIPVENTLFGVAKLVLLLAFATALPRSGILLSWFVPMLLAIPAISALLFRSSPLPERRSSDRAHDARDSLAKLALDYLGYLFNLTSTVLLPVVALELLSVGDAAVFAVAWLSSSTLDLLATNLGTALTVESTYGADAATMRRTVLRRALPLVAAVSAVGLVAAPLVLDLYGGSYSVRGTVVLQLLLLASLPRAVVILTIAEARAHRDIGFIVLLRAQNTTVALGGAAVLAPRYGARGMALAWLVAQLLGGATAARRLLSRRHGPVGATGQSTAQAAGGPAHGADDG